MKPHMVYMAQPIDHAHPSVSGRLRQFGDEVAEIFSARGSAVFFPARGWALNPATVTAPEFVEHVNQQALSCADLVVAAIYPGMVSFGVPAEITRAVLSGKMVAVVNMDHEGRPGVALGALINTDQVWFFQTVDEFKEWASWWE